MKRKCYYFCTGTTFDKNDKKVLKDCWNCNPNCCKSDLCNGLWTDDYGVLFNEEETKEKIKFSVEHGINQSFGYMKAVTIDLDEEEWNDIDSYLLENYSSFKDIEDVRKNGFLSFEYYDIIDDNTPYWEQPDVSYLKKSDGTIAKNVLEVKSEEELDSDIIKWINDSFYSTIEKHQEMEL